MPSGFTSNLSTEQPRKFPWRVFWFLVLASLAGAAAMIPFALEVFRSAIESAPLPPVPFPLLILIGVVENFAFLALVVWLGLWLGRKLGLGAPLLESWLYHEKATLKARDSFKSGVAFGFVVGVIILVVLLLMSRHFPGLPFTTAAKVAVWKRFLICFYGGVDEEILAHLFLLSFIAWLVTKIFRKEKTRLSPTAFWSANIIVAVLFGLGHLPNASMVMSITPTVVVLALTLNSISAIPFGYLYRKRGLESAMIAHFCADFVIYVIGVTFLRV